MSDEALRFSNAMKCIVKKVYATERDARAHAERLEAALRKVDDGARIQAYQCLSCCGWHVGKAMGSPRVHLDVAPAEKHIRERNKNLRKLQPREWRRDAKRKYDRAV